MSCISKCITRAVSLSLLFSLSFCGAAQDKKQLEDSYSGKFVVVLREGLAVGLCSQVVPNLTWPARPILRIQLVHGVPEYEQEQPGSATGCVSVVAEPIHKGEVLKVNYIRIQKIMMEGTQFFLAITNVSPHSIERGVGAFAHQSNEQGIAVITFRLDPPTDVTPASRFLNDWFKVFDTSDAAMAFGNTASGVYVKEIKTGMTPAEVEAVLGTPQTRIDLTDKVLYKYKDMTIEFRDGKVADVR